ncbi:site-specific DNA-methyltransferase [Leptospira montravelensis]|uniref:site-specific DNA-methyltransferase (adenine-specific) n=1 Tax=Leptospira montravelensis TaxID=2484961 RepID=A0ABY2LTI0_9LEPT|nr:site-specific DNA-methyltransferase [Leptospira montravelensis]TGK80843.1 site-specific DNA-methyltransferase [Leptospira montravelensis]TGL01565.1 site-specific DNA-methyltransferase [Leptospira montravelensis]
MTDEPQKLPLTSHNLTEDKLRILKEHFPEVFTEGNLIDWDKLRLTLGETIETEDTKERFGLNWPGKRNCFKAIQSPTTATLLPDRAASVDFDSTENLYIEGDNLEVLKLLQKSYLGKVKMIYIDPPYNTGNDFVYPDDYTESLKTYLEYTGQVDAKGRKFSNNTETTGRFHSQWLNMMYPRLFLARNLLREDGVIFISIDDGEVAHLRKVCDEIFGEENFKSQISWQKRYTRSNNTIDFTTVIENILVYARSESFEVNLLDRTDEADSRYTNPDNDARGPWKGASFLNPASPTQRPNLCYTITNPNTKKESKPTTNAWRRSETEYKKLLSENKLYWGVDGKSAIPSIKMFLSEARNITPINFWDHEFAGNTDDGTKELKDLLGEKCFDNPKPSSLIRRVLEHSTSPDDIVLDFFSGSATTAHAVLTLNAEDGGNRKFICVQLPEPTRKQKADGTWEESEASRAGFQTISEIGMERIRRVITKLKEEGSANTKDSGKKSVKADQSKKEDSPSLGFESGVDQLTKNREDNEQPRKPQDLGFRVFKLAPSNFPVWNGNIEKTKEAVEKALFEDQPTLLSSNALANTEEAILYEVLLKSGISEALANPNIKTETIAGKIVYIAEETAYYVLGKEHNLEVFNEIMRRSPSLVIAREIGFSGNDVLKANVHAGFKQMKDVSFQVV